VLGFDESVTIDLDRLIVGGHSFGGMTAIATAHEDPRVKAIFGFDPWLWVVVD
jgi:pimeloyl-ACP methyl ester carboxylesterase